MVAAFDDDPGGAVDVGVEVDVGGGGVVTVVEAGDGDVVEVGLIGGGVVGLRGDEVVDAGGGEVVGAAKGERPHPAIDAAAAVTANNPVLIRRNPAIRRR